MTSTEFTGNRDNYCYRHPDRQSFVLCQRCLRTVCPECQTPAAVGVVCPECMKQQQKDRTPAQRRAERRSGRGAVALGRPGAPIVTYAIIAVTGLAGLLQLVPGLGLERTLAFYAPLLYPQLNGGVFEPWRLLTPVLVHGGVWHFALNMLALWMIGRNLEPMIGRARFLVLYVLGAVGGSVGVACIDPGSATIGASGAVFALFGALLVIGLHLGANMTGLLVVLGINLVIGFIPSFGIAWQAHLGGAVVGALLGLVFLRTRQRRQRGVQIVLVVAIALGLIALVALVPPLVLIG